MFDQEMGGTASPFVGIYKEDNVKLGNSSLQFDNSSAADPSQMKSAIKARNKSVSETRKNFLRNNAQNLKSQNFKNGATSALFSLSKSQFERSLVKKYAASKGKDDDSSPTLQRLINPREKMISTANVSKRIPMQMSAENDQNYFSNTSHYASANDVRSIDQVAISSKLRGKNSFDGQSIKKLSKQNENHDLQTQKTVGQKPKRKVPSMISRMKDRSPDGETTMRSKPKISKLNKQNISGLSKPQNMVKADTESNSDGDGVIQIYLGANDPVRYSKQDDQLQGGPNFGSHLSDQLQQANDSETSSNIGLVANKSSGMCNERNAYLQELQHIMNRKMEQEFVKKYGIKPSKSIPLRAQSGKRLHIGKIKNQINSAIFYLQKSIVADSETKYYVFNYESSPGPGAKESTSQQQVYSSGMVQIIDVVEGHVPVFCKVTLPIPKSQKSKNITRQYELKFKFKDMGQLVGDTSAHIKASKSSGFQRQKSLNRTARPIMMMENFLSDLIVYVSSQNKEPNEYNCEMKVENKKRFVFKCLNPSGFIYFTLMSKDGCKMRVALEYLGLNEVNKESKSQGALLPGGRQKYQRFNITAEKRPLDTELLEELYPPAESEYRSMKDKEDLVDDMMKELTDYHQYETRKAYTRSTDDSNEAFRSFVKLNLQQQGKFNKPYILEQLFQRLWKRDQRTMLAKDKRELIDHQRRQEIKYEQMKWDLERIQREQAKDIFVSIFRKQKKVRTLISLVKQRKIILTLKRLIQFKLRHRRRIENQQIIKRKVVYFFQHYFKQQMGQQQQHRFRNIIRRQLTIFAGSLCLNPYGQFNYTNRRSDDKNVYQKMPKLIGTFKQSIFENRAKQVMLEFLQDSHKANHLHERMLESGSLQRIKNIAMILFDQRKYRKKMLFTKVYKEIEYLIQIFEHVGTKKERKIADQMSNINKDKLENIINNYINMKSLEFRESMNKKRIPMLQIKCATWDARILERQRKLKFKESVSMANPNIGVEIHQIKKEVHELHDRIERDNNLIIEFRNQIVDFRKKQQEYALLIFSDTHIVDDYQSFIWTTEHERISRLEDPYERKVAFKAFFDKVKSLRANKKHRAQSKLQIDLMKIKQKQEANQDEEEEGNADQFQDSEKFFLKPTKDEIHRIIFKSISEADPTFHSWLTQQPQSNQATQPAKEKEDNSKKVSKEKQSKKKK